MLKENPILGLLEDVVGKASLVEGGVRELAKFAHNTPGNEMSRRTFLKTATIIAGLTATGQLSCSTKAVYKGKDIRKVP